jgi:hypothetical protein
VGRVLTNVLQKSGSSEGSALGKSDGSRASKSNAGDGGSNTETEKGRHCKFSSCIDSERDDRKREGEKEEKGRKRKKNMKKIGGERKSSRIRQNISQMVGWLFG